MTHRESEAIDRLIRVACYRTQTLTMRMTRPMTDDELLEVAELDEAIKVAREMIRRDVV